MEIKIWRKPYPWPCLRVTRVVCFKAGVSLLLVGRICSPTLLTSRLTVQGPPDIGTGRVSCTRVCRHLFGAYWSVLAALMYTVFQSKVNKRDKYLAISQVIKVSGYAIVILLFIYKIYLLLYMFYFLS